MIEIEKKSTWKEIQIEEVFAFNGCWSILCKISNKRAIFIDSDKDWCNHDSNYLRGEVVPYKKSGGFKKFNIKNVFNDDKNPFGCLTEHQNIETDDCIYKLKEKTQRLWKEE